MAGNIKTFFRSIVLAFIVILTMLAPAYADPAIDPQDLKIISHPQIELNKPLSLEQAITQFGVPLVYTINYGDTEPGWHATFRNIELWVLGAADKQTAGLIARVIISDPAYTTVRGVAIGDNENTIFTLYGRSEYSSSSEEITWYRYFVENSLQRIIFGIDNNGKIIKIGYAVTAGGL